MKARVLSAVLVLLLGMPGAGFAQFPAPPGPPPPDPSPPATSTTSDQLLTLPGPQLGESITGWSRLGLQVTALQDVVLKRFAFSNQGLPDVIRLEDAAGNVLGEYPYPGGEPLHQVEVSWPLSAGATYYLVSENGDNGRWSSYYDFPTANAHLQVNAAVGNGTMCFTWWFNFNALQTEGVAAPAPDPGPGPGPGPSPPATLAVGIDVKPGNSANVVNLKSRGKIPVAILSDALFDATAVDPASIRLAGAGVAARNNRRLMVNRVDVNGDGLVDLRVMFNTFELVPELLADGVATLSAVTADGEAVEGSDRVTVVPKPKKATPRGGKK